MIDIAFHTYFELDQETLHYFSIVGRALHVAQHYESNVRGINGLLSIRMHYMENGNLDIENPEFRKKMKALYKKSLGKQQSTLKKYLPIDSEFDGLLTRATTARNRIAHESLIGMDEHTTDFDARIEEIEEYVREIAEADLVISLILQKLNKDLIPSKSYLDTYVEKTIKWVLQSTFED